MLAIAYSASIGGLATIIGIPPNVFLVGFQRNEQQMDVTFLGWLRVGLPLVAVLLPLAWLLLTRWIHPLARAPIPGVAESIRDRLAELGELSRPRPRHPGAASGALACALPPGRLDQLAALLLPSRGSTALR